MSNMLITFGRWLAQTPLSHGVRTFLYSQIWPAPAIQSLHILSIAVVIGCAGAVNLRLLGVAGRGHSVDDLAKRFIPILWTALVVLLMTGSLLILNRPVRYFRNWSFLTKMVLVITACAVTLAFQASLRHNPRFWESSATTRRLAKALGAGTLLLWIGVIFAGRWIAYI